VAWAGSVLVRERSTALELAGIRDDVRQARFEAEACLMELGLRQDAFLRLDARVDSLRGEVSRYEAMDERGVPQPEYDAYLAMVERYNRSVEAWESRAEALQVADAACRASVERHNHLADSLRGRLDDVRDRSNSGGPPPEGEP
jgi:hypothetical protein